MVLHILRALFVLLMAAAGWALLKQGNQLLGNYGWLSLAVTLSIGVLILCVDILAPRKKLAIFSGTFLGLVVGLTLAYALSFVVQLVADQTMLRTSLGIGDDERRLLLQFANLVLGIVCCYLSISFILQTKDDFRFVIPYVEFNKQTKGPRPILLDTSVLIDGRESQLIVPRFILMELQMVADSSDRLKRNRGRRGLDVLAKLQHMDRLEVIIYDSSAHDEDGHTPVDQRLMKLGKLLRARVLTNDFNLNKVAQLQNVDVININDLANALKPVVLPGEKMNVRLLKPGEEPGQGVGYLEDGTMVVVEQGRSHVNEEVEFTVTSFLQTSAGKMIFGRLSENGGSRYPRGQGEAQASPS
jgi:uncharacterized protein YacL